VARRRSRVQQIESLVIVAAFAVGITLPLIDRAVPLDPAPPLKENRYLATKPTFRWNWESVEQYPKEFEQYYRDHLGFRDSLIRLNSYVHTQWLKTSPLPSVFVGKDGWLFLGGGPIEYYRGREPEDPVKRLQIIRLLEERERWLADQGIPYLIVIVPAKSSIYSEYIPESVNRVRPGTFLDDLLDYAGEYTSLETLDLRTSLVKAKGSDLLYQVTGTHWSDRGAFVGYRQIAERLSKRYPAIVPTEESDLISTPEVVPGNDLSYMVGLDTFLKETEIRRKPRTTTARRSDDVLLEGTPDRPNFALQTGRGDLPKAVAFRDSFTIALVDLLSEDFRRIAYIDQLEFNPEVVRDEDPDIVLLIMAERALISPWTPNPLEVSASYLDDKFSRSDDVRFHWTRSADRADVKPVGGTEVHLQDDTARVRFPDETAWVQVPVSKETPPSLLVARMDLFCPQATELTVRYTRRKIDKWSGETFVTTWLKHLFRGGEEGPVYVNEEYSFQVAVPAGRHVHHVAIDAVDLAGPVELRLEDPTGVFEFHDLEIRNVPYPHEVAVAEF